AALMGGGLAALWREPLFAGLCFGLLTWKPHLGLLLPLALLVGGHWRAIGAAALTALALVLLSLLAFGLDAWRLFWSALPLAGQFTAEGALPWDKMVSVFAALRLVGFPSTVAYAVHGAVALAVAVATLREWRRPAEPRLAAALLAAATPLISPYFY